MKLRNLAIAASIACGCASPALAYVGPGAGLGALGTLAALVGAVLLLIVGFVWYPVKRMLRRRKSTETETGTDNAK